MDRRKTPQPEDSAAVVAQKVRVALKADGYKITRDVTVRRDRTGAADTIIVTIKRLGIVRAKVEATVLPEERVHLDENKRRRIDVRHVYVRVEYLPALVEPFRIEARRVLQSLTKTGQRVQIADYVITCKADGFQIGILPGGRREMAPIVYRSLDEAARVLGELVVSDGWEQFHARPL